jgi:hypothetical protein
MRVGRLGGIIELDIGELLSADDLLLLLDRDVVPRVEVVQVPTSPP